MSRSANAASSVDNGTLNLPITRRWMSDAQHAADTEVLARMAARLAGRDPDEHVRLKLGDVDVFDGAIWRYPDFLARAQTAYRALIGTLKLPA